MNREKEIFKVTLVGSAANVLLTVFKFIAGVVGNSAAMVADAVHSLSDLLTDAIREEWGKAILESGSAAPDAITGATLTFSAGSVQEAMTEILDKINGK